jgi:dynactin 1
MSLCSGYSTLFAPSRCRLGRRPKQYPWIKLIGSKLVAEVESIVQAGSALLPDATAALSALATSVSNAVDLAVQLAQRISAHVSTLHASKAPLRLADIETFLNEVTAQSAHANEAPPWELIGMFVQRLHAEIGAILPKVKNATKAGQVVSSEYPRSLQGRQLTPQSR